MNLFKLKILLLNILLLLVICKKENHHEHRHNEENHIISQTLNFCDAHTSGCEFEIWDSDSNKEKIIVKGVLNLNPKPVKAMENIEFQLILTENQLMEPEILLDLSMPGMYMGDNKVKLKKISNNMYRGYGVFPECMSEHRRWNIKIIFEDKNQNKFSTDIKFDIIQ